MKTVDCIYNIPIEPVEVLGSHHARGKPVTRTNSLYCVYHNLGVIEHRKELKTGGSSCIICTSTS